MTYTELKTELENAPDTWMPALLIALVENAYRRGTVFVPGGAGRIANSAEQAVELEALRKKSPTLRDQPHPGDGRDGGPPAGLKNDEF